MDQTPHLEAFQQSLESWTDQRFISREELEAVAMFTMYLVNLLESVGTTYDGHSLRIGAPMSLLVVRGTIDGIPHVAFTSARTTAACMRIFLRKLDEGLLEWTVDRFR